MKLHSLSLILTILASLVSPVLSFPADNLLSSTREVSSISAKDEVRRWEVTGPFGGDVRAMVGSPENPDWIYLGTSDGQLFRSTDAASTWQRVKPGINKRGLSIDNLVFDPQNPKVMYAGVWAPNAGMNSEAGVYKSENSGETWKLLKDTKGMHILSVTIAPSDSNLLFAGSGRGLYRSTDAGDNWQLVDTTAYPDIRNINSVACDPNNPQVIYAGTHHLSWKSNDGGTSWKQNGSTKTGVLDDSDIMGITVDQKNPSLVYMNACSGIYRSLNGGEKWSKIPGIPFSARRTYYLLPHPTNPNVIFAGTSEGLWRTKDNGRRWMLLTPKSVVIRSVVVHPEKPDRVLIATDDFGVQISHDLGDNFVDANSGFINRHILAFLPDATERDRILASVYHDGNAGNVFASTDSGETWKPSSAGLGTRDVFTFHQSLENPEVVYAGTNAGVYRSNDRGATWAYVGQVEVKVVTPVKKPPVKRPATRKKRAQVILPGDATTGVGGIGRYQTVAVQRRSSKKPAKQSAKQSTKQSAAKKPAATQKKRPAPKPAEPVSEEPLGPPLINLAKKVHAIGETVDPQGGRALWAASMDGLYRTADEARGWEKVYVGDYDPNGSVYSISTSRASPGRILLGVHNGLYVSPDYGATWQFMEKGPEASVKAIAQDPRDPNNLLVGTNQFVYRSTNGGRSWIKKGGGLQAGDYTAALINPNNSDEMYVAEYSRGGIYRSKDRGVSWERIDGELPSNRIWALMFDQFNKGRIYAGSFSSGVYILTIQRGASASGQ